MMMEKKCRPMPLKGHWILWKRLAPLLFILTVLIPGPASGQGDEVVRPPSTDPGLTPNGLGTGGSFGDIVSPNLFDGSADISIPFYRFGNEYGNFGISIHYNTKGIKVDEVASPIGLHWNLAAGGSITRVIKDIPDEILSPSEEIAMRGKKMKLDLEGMSLPGGYSHDYYEDQEHDDFTVSAGPLSFTFNLGKDGYIFTHPHSSARIEMMVNGSPVPKLWVTTDVSKLEFRVTDNRGVQYYFRKGAVQYGEKDNGNPYFSSPTRFVAYYTATVKWDLEKIIFPDGSRIKYHYEPVSGDYALYQSLAAKESESGVEVFSATENLTGKTGNEQMLVSIDYPNNVKAEFIYKPAPFSRCDLPGVKILDQVKISSGGNCLFYLFEQWYAHSNEVKGGENQKSINTNSCQVRNHANQVLPNPELHHRMVLRGITINGCEGGGEQYYSFAYDPGLLPPRLSGSQDYFGYHNGKTVTAESGRMTIPYHSPVWGGSAYGVDKNEDASFAKNGILTEVRNKTGGVVKFEYEAHELANVLPNLPSDPLFFGKDANDGIRLKSMKQVDSFSNDEVTVSYAYSGGQRFLSGGYFHYPTSIDTTSNAYKSFVFTGIYVSPHQFINGSNHGYSTVSALTRDRHGQQLSRKEITFTNLKDASSNNVPRYQLVGANQKHYYQLPYSDKKYIRDWELGLPLKVGEYDHQDKVLSEVTHQYLFTLDSTSSIGKISNDKLLEVYPTHWFGGRTYYLKTFDRDTYRPYTGRALRNRSITRTFVSDHIAIVDTMSFSYDSRDNLSTVLVTNSKKQKILTRQVYNYSTDAAGGSLLKEMTDVGLEKIVGTERWMFEGNKMENHSLLVDGNITVYGKFGDRVLRKYFFDYRAGSPVSHYTHTGRDIGNLAINPFGNIREAYEGGKPDTHFRPLTEVTQYDAKGNPLETRLLGGEQYTAMIWDTLSGNKIAEVANARYNEVKYIDFETGSSHNFGYYDATKVIAHADMPGGGINGNAYLLSPTPMTTLWASGLTAGKEYIVTFWAKGPKPDFSGAGVAPIPLENRYSVDGWDFYMGKFTPSLVGGTVGWMSQQPVYIDDARIFPSDALMTSRTYEPLFGISSETDESGRVTYYYYDSLGRLELIRNQEGHILFKKAY